MSTVASVATSVRHDGAVAAGTRVLRLEAAAVAALAERIGTEFERAVDVVSRTEGRVVVSGVGKSGIIARKVAATLTSTGTPAVFVHPVDALHGDLGLVGAGDVMVLLSKSGATTELNGLLDFAEARGVPVVALAGDARSSLARRAETTLDCSVPEEACPMGLAPTTSTTAALAMGDALAVAVLARRGFGADDFAGIHPGGALGRRLRLRVRDVMEAGDYPATAPGALAKDVVVPLARMRGTVPVVDENRTVIGVVTAGDLTRLMESKADFRDVPVSAFMSRSPKVAAPGERAAAALRRMEEHGVMALPVVGQKGLEGIVHLHDLLRASAS